MKILVINGPNLNMLGIRNKEVYGSNSYNDLINYIKDYKYNKEVSFEFYQSNHEGNIIDKIHEAYFSREIDGIVINPGAYAHTSIAIKDAIESVSIKTIEVHLSNIYEREQYRNHSYTSEVCFCTIVGHGFNGYIEAVNKLINED